MSDHNAKIQDDPWLIEAFKEFEKMPRTDRDNMDWSITTEFQVFSTFLINDIRDIKNQLKNADDKYLYYVCRRIFNILDWMKLIIDQGFTTFAAPFENLFEKQFGDKHVLQNTYDVCFANWLSQKNGQQKIGENFYNILNGKLYYRNRFGQWFEVDQKTAFDLKPSKKLIKDKDTIGQLDREYKETWYDIIIKKWKDKQYQGILPDDFLKFSDEETSPEAYFDFSVNNIKLLLKNPVSIVELERWNGGKIIDLEDVLKISILTIDVVTKIRKDNSHTLYLLRDCLTFYEAQKTIDILDSRDTSVDQILMGRKLLSHASWEWGYYILTLSALYDAHKRYPTNFEEFYNDYARLLDIFVSLNPGFAKLMTDLAVYIKNHIRTDKERIVVFDTGFQGSIALLTKYIIDHYISPMGKIETDIKLGVGALWSAKLYGERNMDDYFPFLNRVQLLARSNDLYHYKPESLKSGKLQVLMGDKEKQHKAAVELIVLVMVTLLTSTD